MKMIRKNQQSGMRNYCNRLQKGIVLVAGMLFSSLALYSQNGEALFKQSCVACHSIGSGKLVGPDLKGLSERRSQDWIVKFVKSPQAMITSGDPDAKALSAEYPMVMPDQAISDADINSIVEYIKSMSGADAQPAVATAPSRSTDDATPAEIQLGQDLFTGIASFENGGPSCLSCHHVSYNGVIPGGLLAKDLTESYTRVGGDPGMLAMLGSPAFPAMQVAFGDRKITDKEIYAITAFLNKVDKNKANRATAQGNPLIYGGGPAAVVMLVLIFLVWFNRKKASVKREIYSRQLKSKE